MASQGDQSIPSQGSQSTSSQGCQSIPSQGSQSFPSQGSQSIPGQISQSKERVWKLKDGNMHVGACSKKSQKDAFMTLDLVFKLDDDHNTKAVGKSFTQLRPN